MLNFLNIRDRGVDFQILKKFFLSKIEPPSQGRGVKFTEHQSTIFRGIHFLSAVQILYRQLFIKNFMTLTTFRIRFCWRELVESPKEEQFTCQITTPT